MNNLIVLGIVAIVIAIVAISLAFATLCMLTNLREDMGKVWTMEQAFKAYTAVMEENRHEMSKMNEYQANQNQVIKKQDADIKYLDGAYKNMMKDNSNVVQFFVRSISKETSYREFRKKFLDSVAKVIECDGEKIDLYQ